MMIFKDEKRVATIIRANPWDLPPDPVTLAILRV